MTPNSNGVKLAADNMSLDMMEFNEEKLFDGMYLGGLAYFLRESEQPGSTFFIY